ncbi:MAG: RdgB/HAM1 family non-canonical purine NTP pyrophosphatase [Vicinamibacterales bacterium]
MKEIVVATTNRSKLAEIRAILLGLPVEILALDRWPGIPEPEETGSTFAENARAKALYYSAATGLPAVAEDSGLEIDALGGEPGVHSARFGLPAAPDYPAKFRMIYGRLRAVGELESAARFVCALALAESESIVFETRAVVEGRIASEPRGRGGFGYDPIFYYPPYGRTLAEVTPAEKAAVSHRGKAFRALKEFLDCRVQD